MMSAEVGNLEAGEPEQVGRAPERHVEPEEPVPEIVDRRRQDDDRHTPPRQMETASSAKPGDGDRVQCSDGFPLAPCLDDEDAERDHGRDNDRGVRHDVGRDPERIAADDQMPADVPAHAPGADELRGEQRPECAAPKAHPHEAMIHCAPQ